MPKKIIPLTNAPTNAPSLVVEIVKMEYSEVKLHIPKTMVNGKKVPSVAPGARWYVYFYYRNPDTGKFDSRSKFDFKHGINRYKTVAQRKAFGKSLVRAYTRLLSEGFNPYEKTFPPNFNYYDPSVSVSAALNDALKQKKAELAPNTFSDWKYRLKAFLIYAKLQGFDQLPADDIKPRHVIMFLNQLDQSGKSINNFRSCLGSLFSKLLNDTVISSNPVTAIKKRKENPTKNKPFTPGEIQDIKTKLSKENPDLLLFMRFVALAFLRPVEVVRIRIKDIDLEGSKLTVRTKTENNATVRLIPQLKNYLTEILNQDTYNPEDFLFTSSGTPGPYTYRGKTVKEAGRRDWFTSQFAQVKKSMQFDHRYGIYSLRHSFSVNLYNSFIAAGATTAEAELKMLPITRHKSVSGLRNYLRDIGALMPGDYSKNITIDF
ncbi:tyrosine-type recombinase/integrase [Cochleicola gelatinilyticus]|uniref:Tyr recombinase domain-containing protein n=1 Tax=Cochleicola gelatinilyticus TaxID=1763537 RepID=A0A167IKT5_9FLAO|nr:site-specific integrase [Cochleicola gelatinilyticus]OAB79759.1 hypothetical protein ULVI_03160 [Cochleicola gelatinilyticus]